MRSLRPSFRALSSLILQSFFSGSHFPPAFLTASRTLISHGSHLDADQPERPRLPRRLGDDELDGGEAPLAGLVVPVADGDEAGAEVAEELERPSLPGFQAGADAAAEGRCGPGPGAAGIRAGPAGSRRRGRPARLRTWV